MSFQLIQNYVSSFVTDEEIAAFQSEITAAHRALHEKTGKGGDHTGWVDLPVAYDKDEFARIKLAAKKIQQSSDLLIVIGIGGSYLGARAVIEFIGSQNYNELRKGTTNLGTQIEQYRGGGLSESITWAGQYHRMYTRLI